MNKIPHSLDVFFAFVQLNDGLLLFILFWLLIIKHQRNNVIENEGLQ